MNELPTPDIAPPLFTTHLKLAAPTSNAASEAQTRLIELETEFHGLIVQTPTLHEVINHWIARHVSLDADTVGLVSRQNATVRFVSLAQLGLLAWHHPALLESVPGSVGLGLANGDTLTTELTADDVIQVVRRLNVRDALRQAWDRYWHACHPASPYTRLQRGQWLYQQHLLASLQVALHRPDIDVSAARLIEAVLLEPHAPHLDEQPLTFESTPACPGALVISVQGLATRCVYRPDRLPGITVHSVDDTLWHTLTGNAETRAPLQRFAHPEASFMVWHEVLYKELEATVTQATGRPGWRAAAEALQATEQRQREWQATARLAAPAPDVASAADEAPVSLFDFGGLQLDVPRAERELQLRRYLERLATLTEQQVEHLTRYRADWVAARDSVRSNVDLLLHTFQWHSEVSSIVLDASLLQAHRDGLLAHARQQWLLEEIDSQELARIEAVVAYGDAAADDSSDLYLRQPLILKAARPEDDMPAQSHRLAGAVVIAGSITPSGAPTGRLLLYWLGEHGGLLRCVDPAELERCLGVDPLHGESVGYAAVSGNLFEVLLQDVLTEGRALHQRLNDQHAPATPAQRLLEVRETVAQRLQVPHPAAREGAWLMHQEQQRIVQMAGGVPEWLKQLSATTRATLKATVEDYVVAAEKAHALMTRDLPPRAVHSRLLVAQRLKQDFPDYDDSPVTIDLPVTTEWQHDIIAGSGAPGVPTRQRLVPSAQRVSIELDALLLDNVDTAVAQRLHFATVSVDTQHATLARTLSAGLTPAYLETLARELDLAQAYEQKILDAYRGLQEDTCAVRWRRECLTRPLGLMLKLQAVLLEAQGTLDARGQAILERVLNARTQVEDPVGAPTPHLLPAILTAGGRDTDDKPTTLSGVTFIQDRTSGITLVCQPEHPTRPLRQYASLEDARLALYSASVEEREILYLASRALTGDPRAHQSRLRQAQLERFDGIIGVGTRWPVHLSLPQVLLESQLGRLITAHRNSSRSNQDLWLEQFTQQSGMVYSYIKMVLGVLPFIGSVVALYDLADAATSATAAFLDGDARRGIAELNTMLLALIDVALDLGTGVAINLSVVRQATRQRQLRMLREGLARPWTAYSSTPQKTFASLREYAYTRPLSLQGLTPGTQGRYAGVYRHAEGDFILIQGHPFEVRWDATAHTWRLKGTSGTGWQRAVALGEDGQWDTHLSLYGVHLYGGGSGGGQTLGRLADQVEPYWPAALRDRLPRFLVDRHYRRQRLLQHQCYHEEAALQRSLASSNDAFTAFEALPAAQRPAQIAALLDMTNNDIRLAKRLHQSWDNYLSVSAGRNRRVPLQQKGRVAKVICERLLNQLGLHAQLSRQTLGEMMHLRSVQEGLDLVERAPYLRQMRQHAITQLNRRQALFKTMDDLEHWYPLAERSSTLTANVERNRAALNETFRAFYQTQHLMIASQRYDNVSVVAEFLLGRLDEVETEALAARSTLLDLHQVSANVQQRRQIHQQARTAFEHYRRQVQTTHASLPGLFDEVYLDRLMDNLDTLIGLIDRQVRRLPALSLQQPGPARSPRLFLDTEGQVRIGDFRPAAGQMVVLDDEGQVLRRYTHAQNDRWQLQVQARQRTRALSELKKLGNDLLGGLDDYRHRVRQYQRQGMLAVDLEHLMQIRAEDLERCAADLRRLDPAASELPRLAQQAQALRAEGRVMRITQAKRTGTPDTGHLDYLLAQDEIAVRRIGGRQTLGAQDYLQEYAIVDVTAPDQPTLWYAHFHYRKADAPFSAFSAAHLKRVADRHVGREQPNVWRGTISPQAAERFFAHV